MFRKRGSEFAIGRYSPSVTLATATFYIFDNQDSSRKNNFKARRDAKCHGKNTFFSERALSESNEFLKTVAGCKDKK